MLGRHFDFSRAHGRTKGAHGGRSFEGLASGRPFTGRYTITGTVRIGATPVARRLAALERASFRLVAVTWSAADGSYAFPGLQRRPFVVMAIDHTGTYNAVVADNVLPA